MLRMGRSRQWPEVMFAMTGSREIDASALLDYFRPLYEWLVRENAGHAVGWDESDCPAGSLRSARSLTSGGSVHLAGMSTGGTNGPYVVLVQFLVALVATTADCERYALV